MNGNIYGIYTIKDDKVGYGIPFIDQNDDTAVRGFMFALDRGDTAMAYNAKDYALYKLGEFDVESGEVKLCDKHQIYDGATYKRKGVKK